jgi:hypothetical protein
MKKEFLAFSVVLFSSIGYAQKTETFDIATYKTPVGW